MVATLILIVHQIVVFCGMIVVVANVVVFPICLSDETPPANAGGIILVQAKLAPYLRALGVQCNVVSLPR